MATAWEPEANGLTSLLKACYNRLLGDGSVFSLCLMLIILPIVSKLLVMR